MKFGIPLAGDAAGMPDLAREAEQAGCESLWLSEHLVWPVTMAASYPYSEDGRPRVPSDLPTYDPWVVLAWVAAHTSRIRLGTSVYILPLRDPHVTARAVASLDLVSGGRALLGVGVGWMPEEFTIAGQEFRTRGARADEIIEILRALWSPGPGEYHGRHYDLPPVHFEPKPPQGERLPILVGGESPAALRRAALLGDGWIGMRHTPESAAAAVRELWRLRGDADLEITVGIPSRADAEMVMRYAEAGVDRVCLRPWGRDESPRAGVERLALLIDEVSAPAP